MKFLKNCFLILLVVVVVFAVGKNFIIKTAITTVGSSVLGAPVKLESFKLSLLKQKIRMKGLQIRNPKGFEDGALIDIKEIGADLDVGELMGGKLHIPLIIVDLNNMLVIKNANGDMNVDALKVSQPKEGKEEKKSAVQKKGEKVEMPKLQIDELRLNVGDVVFKDYTKGETPDVQAFDVGIKDKVYKNITSPEKLVRLIMTETMAKTAITGAKIYAAAILGAGFAPAGVAAVLLSDASSVETLNASIDQVYDMSFQYLQEKGRIKKDKRSEWLIKAKVDGADVVVQLKADGDKTEIEVSAKKLMIPKPKVAGGILYEIKQKL